MELKIEDLVESIKKDGIDTANAKAEEIIKNAEEKAAKIIADAKAEQEKIKEQSSMEIETLKESARVSTLQAQRDAVLLFESAVKSKFEKILEKESGEALKGDNLAALIKAAMNGENPSDYVAEISSVADGIEAKLATEIKNGLEIKISPSVKTGFRLSAKDGSGYFDCSNEEITKMLEPFFSEIKF